MGFSEVAGYSHEKGLMVCWPWKWVPENGSRNLTRKWEQNMAIMSTENTLEKFGHSCEPNEKLEWKERWWNIMFMMESNLEYLNDDGKKPVRRVVLKI